MANFSKRIRPFVDRELSEAQQQEARGYKDLAFAHLERAHVLGQSSTREHVRAHTHMLLWAVRQRNLSEATGQVIRIIGAATKTAFGLVPDGNTGGSNVSPLQRLPIPEDLALKIAAAKRGH